MLKKLKKLIAIAVMSSSFLMPLVLPGAIATVSAQSAACNGNQTNISGCLSTGACLDTTQASCQASSDPNGSVNRILTTVINIFSLIVGVVAVIMIIIGGLRYITSGGDSGNVTNAKNTILYAIVGLVIVALAQVIVHFVLARVNGTG